MKQSWNSFDLFFSDGPVCVRMLKELIVECSHFRGQSLF